MTITEELADIEGYTRMILEEIEWNPPEDESRETRHISTIVDQILSQFPLKGKRSYSNCAKIPEIERDKEEEKDVRNV